MRTVDLTKDPRRGQFEYFRGFADPYVGVTANCDITELRRVCKERGYPFFLSALYCAVNAANAVPELRRRICGETVVEYERCISSHTVALDNGSYCYCELDCGKPFAEFLPYALTRVAEAKSAPTCEDGANVEELFFVSSLPWVSFTGIRLPPACPADSNPRITFGKYFLQAERVLLPVDLTVNHALADGLHIARFFEGFARNIAAFAAEEGR